MTPYEDSNDKVYEGCYIFSPEGIKYSAVRPVVNLNKCAIGDNDKVCNESLSSVCKNRINYKTEIKYNKYEIGDEIEYKGEKYYVINNSASDKSYVTLLKANPLMIDELYKYGRDKNNHLFVNEYVVNSDDPETVIHEYSDGSGGMAYQTNENCRCELSWNVSSFRCDNLITNGCSSNYDLSDVKKVLDNWSENKLDSKDLVDVDGYKIRLITVSELKDNLGYDYQLVGTESRLQYTSETPIWAYNENYNYWTMTQNEDSQLRVYANFNSGFLSATALSSEAVNIFNSYAVRPVINLNKCAIEGGCFEEEIQIEECVESDNAVDGKNKVANDHESVTVENTLKKVSSIVLIISLFLIISGLGILGYNYIKSKKINND